MFTNYTEFPHMAVILEKILTESTWSADFKVMNIRLWKRPHVCTYSTMIGLV